MFRAWRRPDRRAGCTWVCSISPQKPWTAAYLAVPFSVYQTLAVARIQAFLIDFHRWLRGESRGEDERLFEEATRLLSDSACERTPLPELADELHISYSRFRQLVRRRSGMSPGNYRIACRIQRARDLLAHRDSAVKEVASQLGYADVFDFTHHFRSVTGITPAAYRQRFAGG